jgi:transglutaminase-like putative cysteine protease
MSRAEIGWPATTAPSLLAALTTWVALWSWAGFVESPSRYLVPVLGSALLVAATGILLRAARLGSTLVLAAQVVLLAIWLTHAWAPDAALGGWLPTPASVAEVFADLGAGVAAAQSYHAPLSDSVPQIFPLLVAAGSLIAVLVDFLACGVRRVPLAGLPLLALYTAPVSILAEGVPWWVFGATALSFLALLATDEGTRLLSWGRRVPRGDTMLDTGGGVVSSESIRTSARRLGLTATGLALVAPIVIPTFSGGFLPGNGSGGSGAGGAVNISNPLVNLRRDLVRGRDTNLLTLKTDDADPSYLRLSVLDAFDGRTWEPSNRDIPPEHRADGLVSRPPGLAAGVPRKQVHYDLSIDGSFRSTWLPTPYPVTTIRVPGDWRYDSNTLDFVSAEGGVTTAGLDYSLTALEVSPRTEDLLAAHSPPEAVFTPYTALPDNLPTRVTELARQVTTGADTRFEKAVLLQRWFRQDGGFRYSLARAAGTGNDDLLAFLSTGPGGRVGYCEQFAAAMAVMGRSLGIPSRVAVGFLRPDRVGPDEYVYSSHDLHAWPEMYFDGVGWVRFEPTPGDRAAGVPGYTAGQLGGPDATQLPSATASASAPQGPRRDRRQLDPGAAASGGGTGGGGPWPELLLLVGAAALALAPRLARDAGRRRRWATAGSAAELAETAWREVRDTALDLRLQWDDTVTLRTAARSAAASFGRPGADEREGHVRGGVRGARANPEAAHALERLVRDVERARYARASSSEPWRSADELAADVETCCAALRAGATKKRRRAATWLPASLVSNGAWRSFGTWRTSRDVAVETGVDRAT